jgi:hypothetical protein
MPAQTPRLLGFVSILSESFSNIAAATRTAPSATTSPGCTMRCARRSCPRRIPRLFATRANDYVVFGQQNSDSFLKHSRLIPEHSTKTISVKGTATATPGQIKRI